MVEIKEVAAYEFKCKCGKECTYVPSIDIVAHKVPQCQDFDDREPDVFLSWMGVVSLNGEAQA